MSDSESGESTASDDPVEQSDSQWREELSEEEYNVLRESGTEARFSGDYVDHDEEGIYRCGACGTVLFESETKYDSSCGWPAFYAAEEESITTEVDESHGMTRTEVKCSNCDSHLGHVFDDGPEPTGKRFCINSVAMDFEAE